MKERRTGDPSGFGLTMLDVFFRDKSGWKITEGEGRARYVEARVARYVELARDNRVPENLINLIEPLTKLFAAQLRFASKLKSGDRACWSQVDADTSREIIGLAAQLRGDYDAWGHGLADAAGAFKMDDLGQAVEAMLDQSWSLYKKGLTTTLITISDYNVCPSAVDSQPLVLAEVELYLLRPRPELLADDRQMIRQTLGIGNGLREFVGEVVSAAGWGVFSTGSGQFVDGQGILMNVNALELYERMTAVYQRMGFDSSPVFPEMVRVLYGHEMSHLAAPELEENQVKSEELLADAANLWVQLETANSEWESLVHNVMAQAAWQAGAEETGADNEDGYRLSGQSLISGAVDSGLLRCEQSGVVVDSNRGKWRDFARRFKEQIWTEKIYVPRTGPEYQKTVDFYERIR